MNTEKIFNEERQPALKVAEVITRFYYDVKQRVKILRNKILQKESDRNYYSWLKTGQNCKNASYEDQDTGIFCFLLQKNCHYTNCTHWRNRN